MFGQSFTKSSGNLKPAFVVLVTGNQFYLALDWIPMKVPTTFKDNIGLKSSVKIVKQH